MKTLFANWEDFWIELRDAWLFRSYHPFWQDDNMRLEDYWPCSDKPQFWPPIYVPD